MFTSKVRTDGSRLLQESNLAARQPRRAPHHVIQVKNLPKVHTWRLEWDSNQQPYALKAPNTTTPQVTDKQQHRAITHLETTSGAIQYGVPPIVVRLLRSGVIWAQNPKSVSFTSPFIPSKTLSLFMSR